MFYNRVIFFATYIEGSRGALEAFTGFIFRICRNRQKSV